MICFEIQYPKGPKAKANWDRRFGLNAYYAGKRWQERKRDAEELHMIARAAMHRAGIRPMIIQGPVALTFYFDDGLDCSNHAMLVKAIEDAMKGYIIKDDSRKYVQSITMKFHGKDCIRVEVKGLDGEEEKSSR